MDVFVLQEQWMGDWFVTGAYTDYELAEGEAKARSLPEDSYVISCITLNAPAE